MRSIQNELDSQITFADSRWQRYCRGLLHDTWLARRRLDAIWHAFLGHNDTETWREGQPLLLVKVHNDGTGGPTEAHYDVEVLVTVTPTQLKTIASGRVENHLRGDGWRALLRRIADDGTVR